MNGVFDPNLIAFCLCDANVVARNSISREKVSGAPEAWGAAACVPDILRFGFAPATSRYTNPIGGRCLTPNETSDTGIRNRTCDL
ncbi:hypothetical protein So717_14510 [Roseobacter cerasinus]|uniref:Uncharacterized protein n=1 Tax=Roseobacter cerasinus TaxID=2602289 RepID=A0A640VMJ8_9RHOB|nr:hypothetical protein So717_14510 [Roseobacter cerasinus]